jgi:hypothetical protein
MWISSVTTDENFVVEAKFICSFWHQWQIVIELLFVTVDGIPANW